MEFSFFKYSSHGNDFILIEGEPFTPEGDLSWQKICHRRFGIGADGILFMAPSSRADFKMVYLNADGAQVSMCGNGARALARHYSLAHPMKKEIHFETDNSIYHARIEGDEVCLEMNEHYDQELVSLSDLNLPKDVKGRFYINTGVPHLVLEWNESIENVDLLSFAPKLRYDSRFSEGVNVNICFRQNGNHISMRTYERGVEDETYACGTGAMAVAHYFWQQEAGDEFQIHTKGGILRAQKEGDKFLLIGASQQVYAGKFSAL